MSGRGCRSCWCAGSGPGRDLGPATDSVLGSGSRSYFSCTGGAGCSGSCAGRAGGGAGWFGCCIGGFAGPVGARGAGWFGCCTGSFAGPVGAGGAGCCCAGMRARPGGR
jgi:hypothetical protein